MPSINYVRPPLTTYQKDIIDAPERFTVTEAATKTGKTASHIIWLFEQSLSLKNNQRVWWVAPVYSQAEIAFQRMVAQISDKNFFKKNETKLSLSLPTGGIIQFKSAEKPDNLYGDDVHAAVFDEFTRAKEQAWFALRSTLTATRGKCKLIGNVKGKKNWGYRIGLKAKQGDEGYKHFRITAYDAAKEGIVSIEEIEQAKHDLPENVFKELYLAEASEDGSNPFGYEFIKACMSPITNNAPVCFGIDLAKSYDYTVIIGLDANRRVCYLDRFQKDWGQTEATILSLPNAPILIDSTGVGDPVVESLQRKRGNIESFKFSSTSKQQLMEGLANDIQKRNIFFPEGIITDELFEFEFEYTRTGVKYTAPQGLHDDTVCALALANKKFGSRGTGRYHLV